jgi:hypothetical protein
MLKPGFGAMTLAALIATAAAAQQPTPTPVPVVTGPVVGDVAPDFSLPGATRYGLLKGPVRLSDLRGKTVVLAFFYQARTKG